MMKKSKRLLLILISLITILLAGFFIYTMDYYKADDGVYGLLDKANVEVLKEKDMIIFHGSKEKSMDTGLIFYPGGKVESTSYIPLLYELSQEGITTVLIEMPLNLAVFNKNAASEVFDILPELSYWYIGGHSLGGAMASSYLDSTKKDIEGLILLASYPIDKVDIPTLVIYGSEDLVLNQDKLHGSFEVTKINCGNHAQFGNYGKQSGDGEATITRFTQQRLTIARIKKFIK